MTYSSRPVSRRTGEPAEPDESDTRILRTKRKERKEKKSKDVKGRTNGVSNAARREIDHNSRRVLPQHPENFQDLRCNGEIFTPSIRGRDRIAAPGGSSPRPMKLCSLRAPKADVHRKGITFSSQELSQTPQNKLQAMTSHCVKNHQPPPPLRNMVSAFQPLKVCTFPPHFMPSLPIPPVPNFHHVRRG